MTEHDRLGGVGRGVAWPGMAWHGKARLFSIRRRVCRGPAAGALDQARRKE